MIDKLDQLFGLQEQALHLRSQWHQILASDIVNADTPNYRAHGFDFQSALQKAVGQRGGNSLPMSTAAAGHLSMGGASAGDVPLVQTSLSQQIKALQGKIRYHTSRQSFTGGSTADMDGERMRFTDNTVRYEADLNIVTQKIRSMLTTIQDSQCDAARAVRVTKAARAARAADRHQDDRTVITRGERGAGTV